QIPIIYFLGTLQGRYQPIIPTFIVGWDPQRLRVELAFGALVGTSAQAVPPDAPERRYALREVKARLHQASFRDAVLTAYEGRCAYHVERMKRIASFQNSHAAFDAHLSESTPTIGSTSPTGS